MPIPEAKNCKLLIPPALLKLCLGDKKNQRNHRVQENVCSTGQPCCHPLDYIRQCGFLDLQSSSWLAVPCIYDHRNLCWAQVPRLPQTLLSLQKMYFWLRQDSRTLLWETQPQRLQRNLRHSHSHLLLRFTRTLSSSSSTCFHSSRVYGHQSSGFACPLDDFIIQRINMACNP